MKEFKLEDLEKAIDVANDQDTSLLHTPDPQAQIALLKEKLQNAEAISVSKEDDGQREANVDVEEVYKQLNELIKIGNTILQSANYAISSSPDSDNISATAALLGEIKDTMKEFTRLYHDKIKFERQKELEHLKAKHKQELLIAKQRIGGKELPGAVGEPTQLVEYNQESIIKKLLDMERAEKK